MARLREYRRRRGLLYVLPPPPLRVLPITRLAAPSLIVALLGFWLAIAAGIAALHVAVSTDDDPDLVIQYSVRDADEQRGVFENGDDDTQPFDADPLDDDHQ